MSKEKEKQITEQQSSNKKEVDNYVKRIRELNTELNNAKEELGEYKRKESSNLEQMLEDPTQLLEEQIEESNKLIKTLKYKK